MPPTTCRPSGAIDCRYDIRQGGSLAPRIAAAYDPTGDGRTSIHAAHGRYDDYQILASVVTGQIVDGSSGVRTLALRLPASIAAWNAPGHRLPEPVTPFPSVEISTTPDLKVPYALHTAVGIDRAIGEQRVACRQLHPRARPVPARLDRLQPDRAVAWTGPQAQRRRRPRRHVGVGAPVHVLRRELVPRPDDVAEQAIQRFASAPRLLHALEGRGHVDGLPDRVPPREQRRWAETRRIPRACRSASIPLASEDPRRTINAIVSSCPACIGFRSVSQVAAIVTAASGRPFTPLAGADLNGDGDGGAFPSDRARRVPRGSGEQRRPQQRNDARAGDRRRAREQAVHRPRPHGLELIAEAFNLFNRSNFSEVNGIFGRGAYPNEPQRDEQGRVTYGLFEQALAAAPDSTRGAVHLLIRSSP